MFLSFYFYNVFLFNSANVVISVSNVLNCLDRKVDVNLHLKPDMVYVTPRGSSLTGILNCVAENISLATELL